MFLKSLEAFKYKIIRFIEDNYKINLLIYNNIHLFKFSSTRKGFLWNAPLM